jgi:hypothetical protein
MLKDTIGRVVIHASLFVARSTTGFNQPAFEFEAFYDTINPALRCVAEAQRSGAPVKQE